jgi:hypothetical protein
MLVATAETYVTLRIMKSGMTVNDVSARLGIEPTNSHEAGDKRAIVGTPFREATVGPVD